jgi:hypothetical protein
LALGVPHKTLQTAQETTATIPYLALLQVRAAAGAAHTQIPQIQQTKTARPVVLVAVVE